MCANYFNSVVPTAGLVQRLAFGLLVAMATLCLTSDATADQIEVFYEKHDDGSNSSVFYQTDDDSYWYTHEDADGKVTAFEEIFPVGNPSPEGDDYPDPGDQSSREALAKQKGGKQKRFTVDHLSQYLTANGLGLSVVWNPSDDEGRSVDSANDNAENLKGKMAKEKGMANGSVLEFQINGQSMADQVKGVIKKGKAGGGSNGSTPPGWKQAEMVNARLAEIYNPNPVETKAHGFLLMGAAQMVGKVTGNGAGNSARIASFGTETLFKTRAYGPAGGSSPVTQTAAPRPHGRR